MLSKRASSVGGISILERVPRLDPVTYEKIAVFFNIKDFADFADFAEFTSHLISLRSSSFSGLSKMANRGRTKSSITLSDKN